MEAGARKSKLVPINLYLGNDRTRKGWAATAGRPLPAVFCLDENFEETVLFLNRTRAKISGFLQATARKARRTQSRKEKFINPVRDWSDFSSIERITPAAALLFASEYDRMRHFSQSKIFAINVEQWKPEVYTVLKGLGLLAVLGIDPPAVLEDAQENRALVVLPMRSGEAILGADADGLSREVAELANAVSMQGPNAEPDASNRSLEAATDIYLIILEAIGNVVEHAYPPDARFPHPVVRRWWMTGAVDKANRKLTLAVYDHGISIPSSLPRWSRFDQFLSVVAQLVGLSADLNETSNDGVAILGAMRVSASSTKLQHRGHGLSLMADYLEKCRDGRLRILSRCGEYVLRKGAEPMHVSHPVSIGGTLVEWEIAL